MWKTRKHSTRTSYSHVDNLYISKYPLCTLLTSQNKVAIHSSVEKGV